MKKYKLNKKQLLAVLISNCQELEASFSLLEFKKLEDGEERKKRILEDLRYLISQWFGFKLSGKSIKDLYNSID